MISKVSASVVTGASTGVGAALSKRLLANGWKVAMIARSQDKMQTIVDSNPNFKQNACVISADLCDSAQCENAYNQASKWYVIERVVILFASFFSDSVFYIKRIRILTSILR